MGTNNFSQEEKNNANQGMTSKTIVKVPERQVLRTEGKKIKDALNKLIQVLEESRRILDVFWIRLYGLHGKLFTFLLVYLFFIYFPYFIFFLDLFSFLVLSTIYIKDCSRYFASISFLICSLYKGMFII